MILQITAALLIAVATTTAVSAQNRPSEKMSPRPVQPPVTQPGFVHSPWTKFCGRDTNDAQAKDTCLTVKEARLNTGQFVAGAALIEQAGTTQKLLRVTMPLGMRLMPGVRMFIDSDAPAASPYVMCVVSGCMADFDVSADFVGKLKTGQQLQLQGINAPGQVATYLLPLADFAQAFDGPPTDPVKFERDQQRTAPK